MKARRAFTHDRRRGGRAAVLLMAVCLAAGTLLGFLGARFLDGGRDGATPGTIEVESAAPAPSARGQHELERPEIVRAPVQAGPAPPELGASGLPARDEGGERRPARPVPLGAEAGQGHIEAQLERTEGLLLGDPDQRLAAANAVLAEGAVGATAHRALNVLIELDPDAALTLLHELAEGPGDDPRALRLDGSMLQRLDRTDGALADTDLVAFFEHGPPNVRATAAMMLEKRGDDSLVRTLLSAHTETLAGDDQRLRAEAARQVSQLQSPAATELLESLLDDESAEVRVAAVRSIVRPGLAVDPAAIERLRPLLDDSSEMVRRAASRTIEMMERMQAARAGRDGDPRRPRRDR